MRSFLAVIFRLSRDSLRPTRLEDLRIRRRFVARSRVDEEIDRLDRAVEVTVEEVSDEIESLGDDLKITQQILESHRAIIGDPALREEIVERIRTRLNSAEYALCLVLRGYYRRFEEMESEYISERAHDLVDIEKKMLRALLGKV